MGRSRWRRAVWHSHRASRGLVLQAQPEPHQPSGRDWKETAGSAIRAGRTGRATAFARRIKRLAVSSSSIWPATANSTWLSSKVPRLVSTSARTTRAGNHSRRSVHCRFSTGTTPISSSSISPAMAMPTCSLAKMKCFAGISRSAEAGFGPAQRARKVLDEEKGPRVGFRRRHPVDLSRGLVRRWPDRSRAHPQWGSVLLAQLGLRPLRRQGHDGQRALVRGAGPLRSARASDSPTSMAPASPTSSISQRDGVQLYFNQSGNSWSASAYAQPLSSGSTICLPSPRSTCLATAPPAWSGRRRCQAMRAGRCATST